MRIDQLVRDRMHDADWGSDWKCAVTTLRILADATDLTLHQQSLRAACAMHSAGATVLSVGSSRVD